jgi:hypothetical protein
MRRPDYTPVTATGTGRAVRLMAGLVGIGLLAGGVFLAGRWSAPPTADTASAAVIRSSHGPTLLIAGVPAGYSRDRSGAAAAAVNFLQVCYTASVGGLDPATIAATSVADTATDAARRMPGPSRTVDPGVGQQLTPLSVTVISADQDTATVTVWAGAVYGAVKPQPVTLTQWATFTVRLVWQSSDWKIADVTDVAGPTPDTAIAAGDQTPLPGAITVFTG